jgi:hypothetical protein
LPLAPSTLPEDNLKKEQIAALANLNKAFLNGNHDKKVDSSDKDVLDLSLPNRSRLNNSNDMYSMMLAKTLNCSSQSSSSLSPLSSISNLSENAAKTHTGQTDEPKYDNKRASPRDENEDEVLNLKQAKRPKLESNQLDANILQTILNRQNLLQQQQRQKAASKSEMNEQSLACLLQLASKQQKEYLMSQNMLAAAFNSSPNLNNLFNNNNSNLQRAKAAQNQMNAYANLLQQQQQIGLSPTSSSTSSNNSSFSEQSDVFGPNKMMEFLNCFKLFSGQNAAFNPFSALSQIATDTSGMESSAQQLGLTLSSLTNGGL